MFGQGKPNSKILKKKETSHSGLAFQEEKKSEQDKQ